MKSKISLLSLAVLFCTTFSFSQTQKGAFMIGGTARLNVQLEDGDDLTTIELMPNIGVFLIDNLALGAGLSVYIQKFGDQKLSTFGLAPFGRYYFGADKVKGFLHGQVGFLSSKFSFGGDDETASGIQLAVGPGVAFFLNKNVAIEGILAYNKQSGDFDQENIGVRFGVQVYLGRE